MDALLSPHRCQLASQGNEKGLCVASSRSITFSNVTLIFSRGGIAELVSPRVWSGIWNFDLYHLCILERQCVQSADRIPS